MNDDKAALRIGVGGPVGSGKTALLEVLCKTLRNTYNIAVVTNDIYTQEDAKILTRAKALPENRIIGVETGGCPHTAGWLCANYLNISTFRGTCDIAIILIKHNIKKRLIYSLSK